MPVLKTALMQQFRTKFMLTNKEKLHWFPGHMSGSVKKMQEKLRKVDCIIEVHDARVPLSGRNPNFKSNFLGAKPHILVLNKADLANSKFNQDVKDYLKISENIHHVYYTDCKKEKSNDVMQIVPGIKELISQTNRFNRAENREYGVLIIGVPNVGKSSLINCLRFSVLKKGGVAVVGAKAGVTKTVQNRIKVSNSPSVFIYDTPGILTPTIQNVEVGMKLASCAVFQDHMVGLITIADFLLYWFNKNHNYCYMDYFNIKEPCDDINLLLVKDAVYKNYFLNRKVGNFMLRKPNLEMSAKNFVHTFRMGTFGPILLDSDVLP